MKSLNVLCCGLPGVLYGIVEASLRERNSIGLLGNYESLDVFIESGGLRPDVIIMETDQSRNYRCALYRYPLAKVVGIEDHGKSFTLWRLVPDKQDLGELSPEELSRLVSSFSGEVH